MLWIKLKIGEAVFIDNVALVLEYKDSYGIVVKYMGNQVAVKRDSSFNFGKFTLHSGDRHKGLRLGFEAPPEVIIRRRPKL
jgi:hypothetical protein